LQQRLNAYALAASAAGVSLLAFAQPAEGRIVYHRANHRFGYGSYSLDLNHDGVADFVFNLSTGINHIAFSIQPAASRNLIRGYRTTTLDFRWASALKTGVKVRSSKRLGNDTHQMERCIFGTSTSSDCDGQWFLSDIGGHFLGLKFYDTKSRAHYGWARLSGAFFNVRLTGYAYETISNKPIITGKTHGPDVITRQDPSLGHLARGASAIPAWRQKEAVEARH